MKYILRGIVILMLVVMVGCVATQIQPPVPREVVITMHNDSKVVKTFWLYWMNHPSGCYHDPYRGLICKFAQMVAETQPGSKHPKIVKENFEYREINGRKFCVDWQNTKREDGKVTGEVEYCFEIEEDTISIYVTPDGVTIEK